MQKVRFYKSVQMKLVLIYMLLIIIAMQIMGLYFANKLEATLKTNFETSILDRLKIVEFSVKEEMNKGQNEDETKLEENLHNIINGLSSDDIAEVQVLSLIHI